MIEKKNSSLRTVAVKILNRITGSESYGNIELSRELTKLAFDYRDKGLITEIVNGTLRNFRKIDFIISGFITGKEPDPVIMNILRAAIYQVYFLDKIPASAAVHEAVETAKELTNPGAAKFVNGVLRNIERSYDDVKFPDCSTDLLEFLSIEYSFPKWLVKGWMDRFGAEFTEALLAASNERPLVTLRVNSLKSDRETVLQKLLAAGYEAEAGKWSEYSILVKSGAGIDSFPGFKEGEISVQDEASMLAVLALDPKPGERVADLCSAPGGKAAFAMEHSENGITITAGDIHPHKLKLMEENFTRLGLKNYTLKTWDAMKFDDSMRNRFDKVILDAPCSGYGVIRKKPDMKLRKSKNEVTELVDIQKKMVVNAAKYLKKGGLLIYSTCTISEEENEKLVRWAVEGSNQLKLESLKNKLPEGLVDADGMVRLYPNVHGTDGFFIAALRKY